MSLVVDTTMIEEIDETSEDMKKLFAKAKKVPSTRKEFAQAFKKAESLITAIGKQRAIPYKTNQDYYVVSRLWMKNVVEKLSAYHDLYGDQSKSKLNSKSTWKPSVDFLLPVDNTDLAERFMTWGVLLHNTLREDKNYVLVNSNVWGDLMTLFGGGPEVSRVAYRGSNSTVTVDVVGITFMVMSSVDLEHYRYANFSKSLNISQVVKELCQRFGYSENDVKLWDFFGGRPYTCLSNEDLQLGDARLSAGQLLLLEKRRDDGSWEIDEASVENIPHPRESRARTGSSSLNLEDLGKADPGLVGLFNLRNTCYMNSTLQALSNIPQLRSYFTTNNYVQEINSSNPLGSKGKLADAFGTLMKEMWKKDSPKAMSPHEFKAILDDCKDDFSGYMQHDAQEFLGVLLDGLHEDVNRIKVKQITEPIEAKGRPDAEVAAEALEIYHKRNDSKIADLFTGMLLSKVVCPRKTCDNVSVTFDPYMMLALPVENGPAKTQEIEITVIPHTTPLRRKYVTVKVPVTGPMIHLRNSVAKAANLEPNQFFLGELSQNKIIRVMNDSSNLDSISADTQIYAFENPETPKHIEVLHGDFTTWFRPILSANDDRIILEENALDVDPAVFETQPDDEDDMVGLEFIRVKESPEAARVEVTIVPTGSGPLLESPKEEISMSLNSKYHCPFEKGQLWVGSFEQTQYPNSRISVRIEVAHVQAEGDAFRIFMLIDINRLLPGTRDRSEQEVRLLVGEYVPTEIIRKRPRRQRIGLGINPGNASNGKSTKVAAGSSTSAPKRRSASSRMISKSVSRFLSIRKNSFLPKGLKGGQSTRNSVVDAKTVQSTPPNVGTEIEPEQPAMFESTDEASQSDEPSSSHTTESEETQNGFKDQSIGKVELDACSWRGVFPSSQEDISFIKRSKTFRCSGSVDMSGMVFHGKAVWGGGFQGVGAMDFFVKLVPKEQHLQHEKPEEAPESPIERKLALHPTRAIRFVNKLDAPEEESKVRRQSMMATLDGNTEFILDPGIILIEKTTTEGQVFNQLVEYYSHLYNDGIQQIDKAKREKYDLPKEMTPKDVEQFLTVRRAGKNYVLSEGRNMTQTGKVVQKSSKTVFFFSKHSFLRVVITWDRSCPIVTLFGLFNRPDAAMRETTNSMKIYDCLDLFCKEEKLSEMDSWYCSKCKQHQEAVKTLQIWSLPAVLVLNFKRFSQETEMYTRKVEHHVDFPLEGLDLRKYALDPKSREASLYDLCAVSSHYGGLGSGHYTAYARNEKDGIWYEFDDETVTAVQNLAHICSRAAYVLFYLRRDLRPVAWLEPGTPVDSPL